MDGAVAETHAVEFSQSERLSDVWDEAIELAKRNAAETGGLPAEYAIEPDREGYLASASVGSLRFFTARLEGKLIGYAVFFVHRHFQYGQTLWAIQDVLYVVPEHRGHKAIRFMLFIEESLSWHVDVIYRHVSLKCDYSRTLERMGYEPIEIGYRKIVNGVA